MRILAALLAFSLAALVAALSATAAEEDVVDVAPAIRAAQNWLALVDSGQYADAWEDGHDTMKESVLKIRFETAVQGVREPLGPVVGRKLRAATYSRGLPGAPPGEYVVIQFHTQFEKRSGSLSTETVTPMRVGDGPWKVSGYFIR
jgi:hypothetical protein